MGREALETVWSLIQGNRIRSTSGKYFITRSILENFFTLPTIRKVEKIGLAEAIYKEGIVLFAILIWIKQENTIIRFRNHRALNRLPLSGEEVTAIVPDFAVTLVREVQWQFLPYHFQCNMQEHHVNIRDDEILPIIREVRTPIVSGFGRIFFEEVHPQCQEFYPSKEAPVIIVRKVLHKQGKSKLFQNELSCLRLLNCLKHAHIVPLLGSYTQNGEQNILFPYFDMDLRTFLKEDNRFGQFCWDFTFFSALRGLASALCQLHDFQIQASHAIDFEAIGYHHDLRPANILVSKETFLLADFGLGKLKPTEENSTTRWKVGKGDYLAPECMDDDLVHQNVGRSIDVWAFGCLVAEIATYIQMGAAGQLKFREHRLTAESDNSQNTYFYNREGNLKPAVREWLSFLETDGPLVSLNRPLYAAVLKILAGKARGRPKMTDVRKDLSLLNLKSHLLSLRHALTDVLDLAQTEFSLPASLMKIWFERERLQAFGKALELYNTDLKSSSLDVIDSVHDSLIRTFLAIFRLLADNGYKQIWANYAGSNSNVSKDEQVEPSLAENFEAKLQLLIQELWGLLPKAQLRKAESLWVQAMIDTTDTTRLERIKAALNNGPGVMYQEAAAMASMKKIRLELAEGPPSGVDGPTISEGEVIPEKPHGWPAMGLYKDGIQILIDWMYHTSTWDSIPVPERLVIMDSRAKGFVAEPKPPNLRILECLGFFEQTNTPLGYGFVYKIPQQHIGSSPVTLMKTLVKAASSSDPQLDQPDLGDKYSLAYKLAGFLMEFHTIGWMHENFHCNNIILFEKSNGDYSFLREPFVMGLQKCRPGSKTWGTEGPVLKSGYAVYQHPAYESMKHYRIGYDYYSLGLMLLEIGLWTPLKVWQQRPIYQSLNPEAFRRVLVDKYVPRLGPRMGRSYRDLVKLCLSDGLDKQPMLKEPDMEEDKGAFQRFSELVVDPLAALAILDL